MKLTMKRVESFTISSALVTIVVLIFVTTFTVADTMFNWDIFPVEIQQFLAVFSVMCASIVAGAFLLNVMVNLSRIASSTEEIARNKN